MRFTNYLQFTSNELNRGHLTTYWKLTSRIVLRLPAVETHSFNLSKITGHFLLIFEQKQDKITI